MDKTMRKPGLLLIILGLVFTSGTGLLSQVMDEGTGMLVSTAWLEEHLADSLLVVLHYGMKTGFEKEHIPGARYVNIGEFLVEDEQGLRNELPEKDSLERALRALGIHNHSYMVICYDDVNAIPRAARLYFTLDYAGLAERVAMLDGGLKAWKEEGRPLTDDVEDFTTGDVVIQPREAVRAQKSEVLNDLHTEGVVIVDARPSDRYYGSYTDTNTPRQGHIEGAVNIPYFKMNAEEGSHVLRSEDELRSLFGGYKIQDTTSVIVYCGSGIWASSVYFAARYLGYKVQLYDGSIQEWGNDPSLPISGPRTGE